MKSAGGEGKQWQRAQARREEDESYFSLRPQCWRAVSTSVESPPAAAAGCRPCCRRVQEPRRAHISGGGARCIRRRDPASTGAGAAPLSCPCPAPYFSTPRPCLCQAGSSGPSLPRRSLSKPSGWKKHAWKRQGPSPPGAAPTSGKEGVGLRLAVQQDERLPHLRHPAPPGLLRWRAGVDRSAGRLYSVNQVQCNGARSLECMQRGIVHDMVPALEGE